MGKSSKSLIAFVLGILILAVGYFGAYTQWIELGEVRAAFDISKTKNDGLVKARNDANAFLAKYENNRAEADKANRALPLGHPDVPGLLDNFSRMVNESGLTLDRLNITEKEAVEDQPDASSSIGTADIEVQVAGTYEAFNDFVLRTQRSLRLIDLISINVTENQESANQSFNFSLKFRTYYQQ